MIFHILRYTYFFNYFCIDGYSGYFVFVSPTINKITINSPAFTYMYYVMVLIFHVTHFQKFY